MQWDGTRQQGRRQRGRPGPQPPPHGRRQHPCRVGGPPAVCWRRVTQQQCSRCVRFPLKACRALMAGRVAVPLLLPARAVGGFTVLDLLPRAAGAVDYTNEQIRAMKDPMIEQRTGKKSEASCWGWVGRGGCLPGVRPLPCLHLPPPLGGLPPVKSSSHSCLLLADTPVGLSTLPRPQPAS